ncbi:MAG: hypothetical protein E4G93_03705, partial [Dehalococcoidia bacterium]
MNRFRDSIVALAMAVLTVGVLTATPAAGAATKYWSGDGTWNATNTNWGTSQGGPYNVATFNTGDDAVFEGTAGTVTVSSPNNPNSITFTVTGYTLSSGTLTLNGAGIAVNTGTATIGSVVAGSVGLTKTGSGTLAINGTCTYSGATAINGGTLTLGGGTLVAGAVL